MQKRIALVFVLAAILSLVGGVILLVPLFLSVGSRNTVSGITITNIVLAFVASLFFFSASYYYANKK